MTPEPEGVQVAELTYQLNVKAIGYGNASIDAENEAYDTFAGQYEVDDGWVIDITTEPTVDLAGRVIHWQAELYASRTRPVTRIGSTSSEDRP